MRHQETFVGPGCLAEIGPILAQLMPRKLLLVTGGTSYVRSGASDVVEAAVAGRDVVHLAGITVNPKLDEIRRGLSVWSAERPSAVVAVGGGSVLDVAKLVGLLGPNAPGWDGSPCLVGTSEWRGTPLIAIPTTAGSGAEATCFATYYAGGEKRSLAHPLLRPSHAIVDSRLTASLPPHVAAATGLDALAQAIESLWAIGATPDSTSLAEAALRLVLPCLGDLVRAPTPMLRERMARGANLAGQAINISRTTAAHALSYALTAELNLPHGHAVALVLPAVVRINARPGRRDVADPRGAGHLAAVIERILGILGCRDGEEAAGFLERQTAALGLATTIGRAPVGTTAIGLAGRVNAERLNNNPVAISPREIAEIYQRLLPRCLAA
jgi:alcohol dehydrogenase class IV